MRLLSALLTLLIFGCNNPSGSADANKNTATGANGVNYSLAETKWRLISVKESENNRLDQFDKNIISAMKKDMSKYPLAFLNSTTMVFGNDQDHDTSTFRIVNDTLFSKDNKGKTDTFLIRSTSTSTLNLYFTKGLDLHFTKVE